MKKIDAQKQGLLALTIEAVAGLGLGNFSLRRLANLAETSTTAIFQNFSDKAELLENALALAVERDKAFHQQLLKESATLLSTHIGLADFIARYIVLRPAQMHARFASEMFIRIDQYPQCHGRIAQWHGLRTGFWEQVTASLDVASGLAEMVSQYVVMEEFYAYALHGDCTYGLLLAETCRALCDAAFHDGSTRSVQSHISRALAAEPLAIHGEQPSADSAIQEQLLQEALQIIESSGLEALNQRRVARNARVSTSAIAYHFKDMKTFRNRAIWRALIHGIPSQFDPSRAPADQPGDLAQWLQTLDVLLVPGSKKQPPGFYIGFARLTGQACLLSLHDPDLIPLISYLRALEGWGTYRVSRSIATLAELISREQAAAFGVWIKSEALMRRAGLTKRPPSIASIDGVAKLIFPAK